MPTRQQRAQRNRRPVRPNTPVILASLVATIQEINEAAVTFQFKQYGLPADPTAPNIPVVLQGIPQIKRTAGGLLPLTASLDDTNLYVTLTYPGPVLSTADTFIIGSQDPAIRTRQGGFVSAGTVATPLTNPTVDPYNAYLLDSTQVRVSPVAPNQLRWTADWFLFQIDETGEAPQQIDLFIDNAVLHFATEVEEGMSIYYRGPELRVFSGVAAVPTQDGQPIQAL